MRNILTEEKLKDKSPRGQVCVEAHQEEAQGRKLRGQGNFDWNTDLIETKKLENYTRQVAQDLYSGEVQHEPPGAYKEQHCRSLHEALRTQSLARILELRILAGWYEW